MIGFLTANWVWILLVGAMLWMHLGHGGHSGHGGHGGCGGGHQNGGTAQPDDQVEHPHHGGRA